MGSDAIGSKTLERESAELRDELANAGNHKACAQKVALLERDNAELRKQSEALDREVERWRQQEEHRAICCVENEQNARKAEAELTAMRERAERAERERDENDARWCAEVGHANKWCARARELEARLARYEAPGPALLVAGHNGPCTEWYRRSGVRRCRAHDCDAEIRQDAHEEQHARCVAVVERVLREAEKAADEADWSGSSTADIAAINALKKALAALTGEAEK